MPSNAIASLANKSGKTKKELEVLWKTAKKSAKKKGLEVDSDQYWAYVMGTTIKMAGLKSSDFKEAYEVLAANPELRLKQIIEFTEDKASTLLLWESCKSQSLAWQQSNTASPAETMNYALNILETSVFYPSKSLSEAFFNASLAEKKRKSIDKNIKNLLDKDEMRKLKIDGYDITNISDDELVTLDAQITKLKKEKNTGGSFAGLLGTVVLGFVGGIAAAKGIDSFFKLFKN